MNDLNQIIYYATTDFCDQSATRERRAHPYSFDAHYIWRNFNKNKIPKRIGTVYSDRLMQWNVEKYKEAFDGQGWIDQLTKEQCIKAIDIYYTGKYKCVGYAVACNVSSGYPLGVFYIEEVK